MPLSLEFVHSIARPVFRLDGAPAAFTGEFKAGGGRQLSNGVIEQAFATSHSSGVELNLILQSHPDSHVARFRYQLHGCSGRLTDEAPIEYLSLPSAGAEELFELRLSEFVDISHSYCPSLTAVSAGDRTSGVARMGPVMIATREGESLLLAYEHGSQYPDAFLAFDLDENRCVLRSVKANFLPGDFADGFESVWFHAARVRGDMNALAAEYREFIRRFQSENIESRKPYVFYNTWNYQERVQDWQKKRYLDDMNQDRMIKEVNAAARLGIDVFVIDTGWFQKTGDWQVNPARFPDGLQPIRKILDSHGMKLGLWFDNAAALSSRMLQEHRDCVMNIGDLPPKPAPIWESEDSLRMCPVSRWWEAFADEMIRLHGEVGVTYFKLDAIQQSHIGPRHPNYCCDVEGHDHGGAAHSREERAARFAYLLPIYMAKIAERVRLHVPGAIVDFDMTEGGRCLGLAFLSQSKFFLINNGPYYSSFQVPQPADRNPNLLFFPGPARNAFCRTTCSFDRWIPLTAMLTHYFPDDPAEYQSDSIASLVLGHGGIWGDLPAISESGFRHIARWLRVYKEMRDDIAAAPPRRAGTVGASGEVHEKINPANGRGAVVIFSSASADVEYVTQSRVAQNFEATENMRVGILSDGRAKIAVKFANKESAGMVFFK